MPIEKITNIPDHPPLQDSRLKRVVKKIREEKKKVQEAEPADGREGDEREKGGRYA